MLPVDPVPAVISDWAQQNTQLCAYVYEGAGEGGKLCLHYKRDSHMMHATATGPRCTSQLCRKLCSLVTQGHRKRWEMVSTRTLSQDDQGTRNSGQTAEFPCNTGNIIRRE